MPLDTFLSPFVGFDVVTKTLSNGHTVDLKADIPAGDGYAVFRHMRKLADTQDPEHMKDITLIFLDAWSLKTPDGSIAPINGAALDNLRLRLRAEIDAVVEAHVAEWITQTTAVLGETAEATEVTGDGPLAEPTETGGGKRSRGSRKSSTAVPTT